MSKELQYPAGYGCVTCETCPSCIDRYEYSVDPCQEVVQVCEARRVIFDKHDGKIDNSQQSQPRDKLGHPLHWWRKSAQ